MKRNVSTHGVSSRTHLVASDLLAALRKETFDLVVSNPPYVDRKEARSLSPEILDHEPEMALFGEQDGTGTIARLLREARGSNYLALEIGAGQEAQVEGLARSQGWQLQRAIRDLAGIVRTLVFSSRS